MGPRTRPAGQAPGALGPGGGWGLGTAWGGLGCCVGDPHLSHGAQGTWPMEGVAHVCSDLRGFLLGGRTIWLTPGECAHYGRRTPAWGVVCPEVKRAGSAGAGKEGRRQARSWCYESPLWDRPGSLVTCPGGRPRAGQHDGGRLPHVQPCGWRPLTRPCSGQSGVGVGGPLRPPGPRHPSVGWVGRSPKRGQDPVGTQTLAQCHSWWPGWRWTPHKPLSGAS